jgi:cyclophilin family peptidyl-prolyl cis-trans isomerase
MKKVAAVLLLALMFAGCSNREDVLTPSSDAASSSASGTPTPAVSTDIVNGLKQCVYTETGNASKQVKLPNGKDVSAEGTVPLTVKMNGKSFTLTLNRADAPCTANSFESLAEQGFYDDTPCHRLTTLEGFAVLQCGDPTGVGNGGPGYQYADELDKTTGYPAGTVAMANAGADTNGSQFFICYEDTQLNPAYTVFGTIDEAGLKLVREIAKAGESTGAGDGAPNTKTTIEKITVK